MIHKRHQSEMENLKKEYFSIKNKRFKCDSDLGYRNKSHLVEQVNIKRKGLVLSCPQCPGEQFKRERRLREHISSVHMNRWYQCNICELKFNRKDSYQTHVKGVHGSKDKCTKCEFEGYKDQLREHVFNHAGVELKSEGKNSKRYNCLKCAASYLRRNDLTEHNERKHKGVVFPCSQCSLQFIRKHQLNKHIKNLHSKIMCHICYFEINEEDEDQIKYHIKKCHDTLICKECGHTATTKSHLVVHINKHTEGLKLKKVKNVKIRRYNCLKCAALYFKRHDLTEHIKNLHSKVMCHICYFEINEEDEDQIKYHIKKFHNTLTCKECSYTATTKSHLTVHMNKHTESVRKKDESVTCDSCGQIMSVQTMEAHIFKCNKVKCVNCDYRGSIKQMKKHERIHIPFLNCESCDFITQKADVMEKHVRRHEIQAKKEKMLEFKSSLYPCSICDYQATRIEFINMHLANIHNLNKEYPPKKETSLTLESEAFQECEENFQESAKIQKKIQSTSTSEDELNSEENVQLLVDTEGKSLKANDKIMSLMDTLQNSNEINVEWTCKSRNLQIFPVNKNVKTDSGPPITIIQKKENEYGSELITDIQESQSIKSSVNDDLVTQAQVNDLGEREASIANNRDSSTDEQIQYPDKNKSTEKECLDCGFLTDDEELYQHHQVTDHLLCYICGFTSNYQKFIFSHMNAIHNILDFEEEKEVKSETSFSKPKPSVCPICSHRCESKKSLERHHSDVHKKQSYKCTRCGLRGARFRTMLKHYRSFHDKEVDSKTVYEESVTDFEFS